MKVRSGVGSWRRSRSRGYHDALAKNINWDHLGHTTDGLTPRENELEFDQFHVREIRVD